MANLHSASDSRRRSVMRIAYIRDACEASGRTGEIVDWVISNVPWTVDVQEWPAFHDRWPLLTRADIAEVEEELRRRSETLSDPNADLDAVAASLTGREARWTAAADWLMLNRGADIFHATFFGLFSQLSRAELILAAIEHKRRLRAAAARMS